MPFQKGHKGFARKKTKPPTLESEPIRCLYCESLNVDGEQGECRDCGTACSEMLAKMWTGKSRMIPINHTMSGPGAIYAQHRMYDGSPRFSGE